jgi:probable F420-dependent oxidoreductase
VKIGLVFPQTEIGNDPAAIRDYAQAAEGLGYSHILAYEHILGANPDRAQPWTGPYTHEDAFHEPFTLFSFMAGVTERLAFTTGVLVLPLRQTALVAKQAACLDVLSGGRLRLGVGVGWNWVESVALNQSFRTRGRRIEEQVHVLRLLWTEPLVAFHGRWHSLPGVGLNPLPVQRPIPIWFGGHADAVLRRIAVLGDGWMPGHRRAADAGSSLDKIAAYLAEAGRSWDQVGLEPRLNYAHGDAGVWLTYVEDWQAAGATHLSLNTMGAGLSGAAAHIQAAERFARAVGL